MVGGYNELTPPTRYYRGPITGINRTYGSPYMSDFHCASCGSTSVSKPSYKNGARTFKCTKCGRKTSLASAPINGNDAVYEIRVQGYTEKDGVRLVNLQDELWRVLGDLDAHFASEKAHQYYGAYYDSADESEALSLESDITWVNMSLALDDGYVYGLNVGEEYNLPDFPVTVARVGDRSSKSSVSANRRPSSSNGRKTTAKTNKPKASGNLRPKKAGTAKRPAVRSTSKPKTKGRR